MNISDEAVEAAAMAIYAVNGYDGSGFELDDYRKDARAALEAAAPHLMAQAADELVDAGYEVTFNPYRSAVGVNNV